jgi:hypothetical protein
VDKIPAVLTEIEQLTLAQRGLIESGDLPALELILARKESLIQSLRELPSAVSGDEIRAVLARIRDIEQENIQAAQGEMEHLRVLMKKAQEGMTTVRGYDALSAGIDATYIDKKQ